MRRAVVALALVCAFVAPARAHVGSPDVFFEGDAGPYRLFVTVRTPAVIPGVATIEIRSESPDVREVSVVPMQLTGPGSQLPPAPDPAVRSPDDAQFFTADLWLMERGSLQVRVDVDGARGHGRVAVPVPAFAQRTLAMTSGLGRVLFALMLVLALAIVGIIAGAVREATLEPGAAVEARGRRRARVAAIAVGAAVAGVITLGDLWWRSEARAYDELVMQPWQIGARVDGCTLTLPAIDAALLPDHGHTVHLFLVRDPDMTALAHLHPQAAGDGGGFVQRLPSLPAGRYRMFVDIVLDSGFPVTGTGSIELPALACPAPEGDDAAWVGTVRPEATIAVLDGEAELRWDRPPSLRAGAAMPLRFQVVDAHGRAVPIEPYMGMAAHAMIVRHDGAVFAHLHPNGSVAMPALELAQGGGPSMAGMPGMSASASVPSTFAFPYGFPQPGDYRVFVQVKRHGVVETGAFDAHVEP